MPGVEKEMLSNLWCPLARHALKSLAWCFPLDTGRGSCFSSHTVHRDTIDSCLQLGGELKLKDGASAENFCVGDQQTSAFRG